MRNNSTRLQGKKKTSTSQYQSFEHNGMEICDQQRLEGLEKYKGGARFMQAWLQKNLQTLYQTTTGRQTHVMRTLWIIVDGTTYKYPAPQNTGLAQTATTLHLGNCELGLQKLSLIISEI